MIEFTLKTLSTWQARLAAIISILIALTFVWFMASGVGLTVLIFTICMAIYATAIEDKYRHENPPKASPPVVAPPAKVADSDALTEEQQKAIGHAVLLALQYKTFWGIGLMRGFTPEQLEKEFEDSGFKRGESDTYLTFLRCKSHEWERHKTPVIMTAEEAEKAIEKYDKGDKQNLFD